MVFNSLYQAYYSMYEPSPSIESCEKKKCVCLPACLTLVWMQSVAMVKELKRLLSSFYPHISFNFVQVNKRTIGSLFNYKDRLPKLIESNNTKCALAEALLLRYLERIGDHAVFMSDAINYIVTGRTLNASR